MELCPRIETMSLALGAGTLSPTVPLERPSFVTGLGGSAALRTAAEEAALGGAWCPAPNAAGSSALGVLSRSLGGESDADGTARMASRVLPGERRGLLGLGCRFNAGGVSTAGRRLACDK